MKTIKRDYVAFMPKPDVSPALQNLAIAFEHYNEQHPHSALKYGGKSIPPHLKPSPRLPQALERIAPEPA